MGPGRWSFTLKDTAPMWLRRRILPQDHVVVTPTRRGVESLTYQELLDSSIYTGVILDGDIGAPGTTGTFGGTNLFWWLGDSERTAGVPRSAYSGTSDLPTLLVGFFTNRDNHNGIGFENLGVPATTIACSWTQTEPIVPLLERWRKATDPWTEYRMRHDGIISWGSADAASMFTQTPKVLITRKGTRPTGRQGGFRTASAGDIRRKFDGSLWISEYDLTGTGGATGAGAPNIYMGNRLLGPYAFRTNAGLSKYTPGMRVYATSSETGNVLTMSNLANAAARKYGVPEVWEVTGLRGITPFGDVKLGDYIALWDPETRPLAWWWDGALSTGEQMVGADTVQPVVQRCTSISWAPQEGMGIYYLYAAARTHSDFLAAAETADFGFYDISDFVELAPEGAAFDMELSSLEVDGNRPAKQELYRNREV